MRDTTTLALIAHEVKENIEGCTTHAEIQSCRKWAIRLYDEHGPAFQPYFNLLMRRAGEMQAANTAAHKLLNTLRNHPKQWP